MLVPTNNFNSKVFLDVQLAIENPKQKVVLLGDCKHSNRPLSIHQKPSKIIPYVPLQPKIFSITERYFYPLMSVFFRLINRLKPIAICSSWRVQKWSNFHHQRKAASMQNVSLIIKNTDQHASPKRHRQGGTNEHHTRHKCHTAKSPCK